MAEKTLQSKLTRYLKGKGCFVMVLQPQAGVPSGTADIFFCKEGFYGWIECKASKNARFQPLQREFVAKMNEWSWARVVYPENLDQTKSELDAILL